ncbi:MAG: hypothetical protein KBD64_03640 [Gammaproteobacteria bacterium]|nr:hypothetical protein [Gammaproteobacteria bacterium]
MNKLKSGLVTSVIVSAIFSLISCAQYESNYTPPKSEAGMRCVYACLNNLERCNTNCSNGKLASGVADAVSSALLKTGRPASNADSNDCGCQRSYEACYKSCGGKIEKVCISGCK